MTKKVKILAIGTVSFLIAVSLVTLFFTFQFVNSGVSTDSSERLFDVAPGTTMTQIAEELQNKGLVRNGKLFLVYSRFKKMNSKLKVGEYSLNQSMTPNEILAVLASGKSVTRNLTIAEGLSLFDIAEILEKSGIGTKTEFFALDGLGKLLNTIKIVQNRLNTELKIEGILMTMYDGRLRLCNQVVSEVRRHFEDIVFSSIIHRNTRLSEAPSFGKPVILYDADSKGAINYLNLAKEILQKNNMTKIKEKDRIIQ